MSTAIAPALSRATIERLTNNIRTRINCNECYFDIIPFVEIVIPAIDSTFNYEYVSSNELSPGMYAYYDPKENTMKILSSVYDRACCDIGRDRFTIAHEAGHYFLHQNGYSFARTNQEVPKYCDPEWQANTFASALLIPRTLTKNLSVEEIKNRCKVSYQAAEIAYNRNWQ